MVQVTAQGGFAHVMIDTKLVASLGEEICEQWHMKTIAISRGMVAISRGNGSSHVLKEDLLM